MGEGSPRMTYAYFPGCKIPHYLIQYDDATRAVLGRLGVTLRDLEFGCCGYPVRDQDGIAYLFSAVRNLALAAQAGLDILTPCKCCFGSLQKARALMAQDSEPAAKVHAMLAAEGLAWEGGTRVRHLMQVLDQDLEAGALAAAVTQPLEGLQVAVHYGCHALRPAGVTQFDDPAAPTIFERVVGLSGAKCVDYPQRLECCGNPLWEKNRDLSLKLMERKLGSVRQSGASLLCSACTYCQMQFDGAQRQAGNGPDRALPSVLLPQLLGLSLGCSPRELGLHKNLLTPVPLERFMA